MISVIIPLYNKEKQIAATLQSVFNQTFQDFEVVIVNDGSTDNSVAIVESFGDSRLRLINQHNSGVSAARNRGIDEAKGEFLAFIDADDEWKPEYLETQMSLVGKYPQCDVFATNYEFRNEKGIVSKTRINRLPFNGEDGILSNYFEVASISHPPLWTSAVMVRRDAILAVGGFPVGIKSGEDLLTWARLACRYKIAYSRNPLAIFKESMSIGESKAVTRLGCEKFIADNLIELYRSAQDQTSKAHLKLYIARWFKVWSVLLIETENNHKAISTAVRGLRWGGRLRQFIPILILSLLPSKMAKSLFYKFR